MKTDLLKRFRWSGRHETETEEAEPSLETGAVAPDEAGAAEPAAAAETERSADRDDYGEAPEGGVVPVVLDAEATGQGPDGHRYAEADLSKGYLDFALSDVLAMLPDCYKTESIPPAQDGKRVRVFLADAFTQLARGRVTALLADIIVDVPQDCLSPDHLDHLTDRVDIPLSMVVSAIPEDELASRVAAQERDPAVYSQPDVFHMEDFEAGPSSEEQAEAEQRPAAWIEWQTDATEPEDEDEAGAGDEGEELVAMTLTGVRPLLVKGVDVNSADAKQLVKQLPGVGPVLAARLIARRPFHSVFDLAAVPGLGPRLFTRLTGEHVLRSGIDRKSIDGVFSGGTEAEVSLKQVAQRIAGLNGISGCVISHKDGHLLASVWRKNAGSVMSAVTAQIFRQVRRYLRLLEEQDLKSMILFLEPHPVFITQEGDLFVLVLIPRSRFSMKKADFVRAITSEMVRRFESRRLQPEEEPPASSAAGAR